MMLGRHSKDKIWSILERKYSGKQNSTLGPLAIFFIHLSTLTQYQVVTSDKRSGVLKAGKLLLLVFVQGIGGARTHWTLKSFLQQFPEICSRALLRNSVNLETNQKPHSHLFSLLRNCFHRFFHHFHPFFNHLHLFDKIFFLNSSRFYLHWSSNGSSLEPGFPLVDQLTPWQHRSGLTHVHCTMYIVPCSLYERS